MSRPRLCPCGTMEATIGTSDLETSALGQEDVFGLRSSWQDVEGHSASEDVIAAALSLQILRILRIVHSGSATGS